jgi:hypothetical protein
MATQLDLRGRRPATLAALSLALAGAAALVPLAGWAPGVPAPVGGAATIIGTSTAAAALAPAAAPAAAPTAAPAPAAPAEAAAGGAVAVAVAVAAARRSPLDALPAGPSPIGVPYAIGTRVYFHGRITDLSSRFDQIAGGRRLPAAQRQFDTVVGAAGFAWTQITAPGVDLVHAVGTVSATGGYTPFHTSSGSSSTLDVTTGGAVAMPENGEIYQTDGRFLAAFTGSPGIDCGSCAMSAVGPRLLIDQTSSAPSLEHLGTWLWYPPAAIQRLPDSYRAVGRWGAGWLGYLVSPGCWRTAPANAPNALRATICSMTTPLVSADGTRAVVVQSGRAVVLDTRTGATISRAGLTASAGWQPPGTGGAVTPAPVKYVVPATWESTDSYLLTARDDTVVALLRCSVRTGACQRAVRAAVRAGVDRIVTERGPDAIAAG